MMSLRYSKTDIQTPNMPLCMTYVCKKVNTSVLHPISNEIIQLRSASYNHEYIIQRLSIAECVVAPSQGGSNRLAYSLVDTLAKKVSVTFGITEWCCTKIPKRETHPHRGNIHKLFLCENWTIIPETLPMRSHCKKRQNVTSKKGVTHTSWIPFDLK